MLVILCQLFITDPTVQSCVFRWTLAKAAQGTQRSARFCLLQANAADRGKWIYPELTKDPVIPNITFGLPWEMEQKELHTHKLLYWHVAGGFGSSLRWLDSKQQARDVPYATTCSYLFNCFTSLLPRCSCGCDPGQIELSFLTVS